jgi:FixJ family two-component response regulator
VTITGKFIAIVDDEEPVRVMLRRVLRLAGYDVAMFASGEAFLASLAEALPACAILDVHLPKLSGPDMHRRLGELRIDIPVVFITASDDPLIEERVRREHASALLRKPFSSAAILDAIACALRKAGARPGS